MDSILGIGFFQNGSDNWFFAHPVSDTSIARWDSHGQQTSNVGGSGLFSFLNCLQGPTYQFWWTFWLATGLRWLFEMGGWWKRGWRFSLHHPCAEALSLLGFVEPLQFRWDSKVEKAAVCQMQTAESSLGPNSESKHHLENKPHSSSVCQWVCKRRACPSLLSC